ncbi:hypothetical protein BJ875DRAFT_487799 [Amylocarpus encephaloides]|uniref:Uncharacterized protein n=1 Tax=Amylocarpus encephaloides TaxID=45428 RepID=A0A9P8C1M8_9HELO|nr:hypothetical protein BJ875DRAFT_487799 [Amylocarpus encephaloides]
MSFIFGSMSQRLQSRNHESDNTSCYHVSCFGHGSCIKELADGASLLDPKHSGKLDDGPRPSGINYNIARFIGSIPSFYETGSGEINDLSVIQEETPIAAECDHLACVNLVTCLYMQGKAEIRKILKTPHTTLPKYLLDQQLQIDRDCFNWNDNKGWAFILKCGKCRHERCSKCEMKVFEELDLLGDKLNAMTDTSILARIASIFGTDEEGKKRSVVGLKNTKLSKQSLTASRKRL